MTHARVVMRDPFGTSPGRSDAPDIHRIRQRSLYEIDESRVRRPNGKVAVKSRCRRKDRLALRLLTRNPHEHGVSWSRGVVDEA